MKRAKKFMIARCGTLPPHRFRTERAGRVKRSERGRPEDSGSRTRSGASPRWSSTSRSRGWFEAASPPASPSTVTRTPSEDDMEERRDGRPSPHRRLSSEVSSTSTVEHRGTLLHHRLQVELARTGLSRTTSRPRCGARPTRAATPSSTSSTWWPCTATSEPGFPATTTSATWEGSSTCTCAASTRRRG